MRSAREILESLSIEVHPDFDFERDSGVVDYANPVLVNNKLILFTNALIELGVSDLTIQQEVDTARRDLSRMEHEQNKIRLNVLSRNAVPSTASKNLALTEAYVHQQLSASEREEYFLLTNSIAKLGREVERLERLLEAFSRTAKRIEFACQNIQTHLSYVKKEQEWSR